MAKSRRDGSLSLSVMWSELSLSPIGPPHHTCAHVIGALPSSFLSSSCHAVPLPLQLASEANWSIHGELLVLPRAVAPFPSKPDMYLVIQDSGLLDGTDTVADGLIKTAEARGVMLGWLGGLYFKKKKKLLRFFDVKPFHRIVWYGFILSYSKTPPLSKKKTPPKRPSIEVYVSDPWSWCVYVSEKISCCAYNMASAFLSLFSFHFSKGTVFRINFHRDGSRW